MGNSNGLVAKWNEMSKYALDHDLINDPIFKALRMDYATWYGSYEDDGTKIPREGGYKYLAGRDIFNLMDDLLRFWDEQFSSTTTKEEVTMDNKKNPEVKTPVSATIGGTIGKGLGVGSVYTVKGTVATGKFIKDVVAPVTKAAAITTGKGLWNTLKSASKAAKDEYRNRR